MNPVRPVTALGEGLGQRRHDRHVIEMPGVLRLEGSKGIYVVTVLDLSKPGLRIRSATSFPAGSRVEIKCRDKKIFGSVRYAREVAQEFNVGIEADRVEAHDGSPVPGELDLTALFPIQTRRPDVF